MAERLKKTAIIFESLPKTTTFAPLSPESTFFEQYLENVSHLRKYLIRFPYARRQWSHKPRAKRSLLIFAEAPETFAADKFSRKFICGNSSVGRARPCQGRGREFESRLPLQCITKQLLSYKPQLLFCLYNNENITYSGFIVSIGS